MPYADPILLEKIIGLELHKETPAFCKDICGAIDRYVNANRIDLLKEVISRYSSIAKKVCRIGNIMYFSVHFMDFLALPQMEHVHLHQ